MTIDIERDLGALAATLRASTVAVRSARRGGSGSGVVWADKTIVTNAHVAMSREVEIELPDGRAVSGRVERRDERRDLATIRVDVEALTVANMRDPDDLRTGELLVAFGHPLGVANVLSAGIAFAPYHGGQDRFVRADVLLAPGNSGGALADVQGRVVGINSMFAGGLALAIPASDVARFAAVRPRPRLGLDVAAVRLADGRRAHAVVAVASNSIAEQAGFIVGDILIVRDPTALVHARTAEVLRGGRVLTLEIDREAHATAA